MLSSLTEGYWKSSVGLAMAELVDGRQEGRRRVLVDERSGHVQDT